MTTQEKNYEEILNELEQQDPVVDEPPVAYSTTQRYSYADYLTWTDNVMREIIGGIVYLFAAPLRVHAASTGYFFFRALTYIRRRKGNCKVYTAPFDVRFPTNGETADDKVFDIVQPDICVVCDPAKLDYRGCIGAPDLIVEVNSPSTSKLDLQEKFLLYQEHGVQEYWIVFPKDKSVTVFLLQSDGKYANGKIYQLAAGKKKIPVKTLKGLVIDLEELFEED